MAATGRAGEERRRDGHALRQVVQADDQGRQDTAAAGSLGGSGKGGADGHTHRHVVQGHCRRQYQPRGVEGVVAAGAHLLMGVEVVLVGLVMVMVMVVAVMAVVVVAAVAVAVVGLLVDPAVEEVGAEVADEDPGDDRENGGILGSVGNEVKAHYAEHHPGGEAQQETDRALRRAVDGGSKAASQGQPAHAGEGGDEKNGQIFVHGKSPILKSQHISIPQPGKKSIKSVLMLKNRAIFPLHTEAGFIII